MVATATMKTMVQDLCIVAVDVSPMCVIGKVGWLVRNGEMIREDSSMDNG